MLPDTQETTKKKTEGAAHTPGPWPSHPSRDHKRIFVGKYADGQAICEVDTDDVPGEEAEANARLIASAPDLLEACRRIDWATIGLAKTMPADPVGAIIWQQLRDAGDAARAAIAKAEGRQS